MYLKVDIQGEEQFFAFEGKNTVTIGRAPNSDIQLLTEGISRNHLVVHDKNGEFFIEDLGSTNGTFLNSERLKPQTLEPFNSFFPIKLGFYVYLYLIDEVSSDRLMANINKKRQEEEEKKRKELREVRKKKLQAERVYVPKSQGKPPKVEKTATVKRKKIAVKAPVSKKKETFMPKMVGVMALLVGLAFGAKESFFNKLSTQETVSQVKVSDPAVEKTPAQEAPESEAAFGIKDAREIVSLDKCLGSLEKALCKALYSSRDRDYFEGFTRLGSALFLALNYQKLTAFYRQDVEYSDEEKKRILITLKRYLGRDFSRHGLEKNNLRHADVDVDSDLTKKAAAVTDMLIQGLADIILKSPKVEKLYIILYDNSSSKEPQSFVKVEKETLRALQSSSSLEEDLKLFWHSGLRQPLEKFFETRKSFVLESF